MPAHTDASDKLRQYESLIHERAECKKCLNLVNMSELDTMVDHDNELPEEIGPWSRWQGNLDAEIMVVAQDWGSQETYLSQKGWDITNKKSPTNGNLIKLMGSIGQTLCPPENHDQEQNFFFTNAALCMRRSKKEQGGAEPEWFSNCGYFLKRQIEIVRPRVVVALGQRPFESVLRAFKNEIPREGYRALVDSRRTFSIQSGTTLVPVFHCGANGERRNRVSEVRGNVLSKHEEDWKTVGECLKRVD